MSEDGARFAKGDLTQTLKGGVIMDVTSAEQARIAEEAGACAVMALERVPADIRAQGGVARMADPARIREIQQAVSIPVMAKGKWTTSTRARCSHRPTKPTISTSGRSPCRSSAVLSTSVKLCGA